MSQDHERPKITLSEFMLRVFGNCLEHRHEQVGRCVNCADCGRRLYQGSLMNADELAALREARALTEVLTPTPNEGN